MLAHSPPGKQMGVEPGRALSTSTTLFASKGYTRPGKWTGVEQPPQPPLHSHESMNVKHSGLRGKRVEERRDGDTTRLQRGDG